MTANFAKLRVKYFTKTVQNPPTADGSNTPINAEIIQNFNTAIIDNAQDWIMAVERFELNLNGIPFYHGEAAETITIHGLDGTEALGPAHPDPAARGYDLVIPVNFDSYSLPEFVQGLNVFAKIAYDAAGMPAIGLPTFTLAPDGYIIISLTYLYATQWTLNNNVNRIMGMQLVDFPANPAVPPDPGDTWTSGIGRWDIGDLMGHIRLTSNLGLTSDTIGQSRSNVMTDIAVIQSISAGGEPNTFTDYSTQTISYTPRQKLQYDPKQRRYINILFPQPIINLTISAYYVYTDANGVEQQKPVQLWEGCEFSIKLGFYKRI